MTFGSLVLLLVVAVSGSAVCPSGKGLCDCISSFNGMVLESATYKLLDLGCPASSGQWIKKNAGNSVADVAAQNPTLGLVTGDNTAAGDANHVCRVQFSVDSMVSYHDPVSNNKNGEPEYHHSEEKDTHDNKWYLGRVYGSDGDCHFGTWSADKAAGGEEFAAPTYDLLAVPSSCAWSWKFPSEVSGSIPVQSERNLNAVAFCELSAVCAVTDSAGVWHPGYAIGAHRTNACSEFGCSASSNCDGVCAGCDGCLVAGAQLGEGAAEGGCKVYVASEQVKSVSGVTSAISATSATDSSALAASVCLLAGFLAA